VFPCERQETQWHDEKRSYCPIGAAVQVPRTRGTHNSSVPPPIQSLLNKNEHLFQEPKYLPPPREYDHAIPLIPGVQPVNVKPYRYNPTQKDEIERQMKEMVLSGFIQPSVSPFASPVLLVKKKGWIWRFCVDYR
jgi:hypothetical protein